MTLLSNVTFAFEPQNTVAHDVSDIALIASAKKVNFFIVKKGFVRPNTRLVINKQIQKAWDKTHLLLSEALVNPNNHIENEAHAKRRERQTLLHSGSKNLPDFQKVRK